MTTDEAISITEPVTMKFGRKQLTHTDGGVGIHKPGQLQTLFLENDFKTTAFDKS
jgi:hypothetical protein